MPGQANNCIGPTLTALGLNHYRRTVRQNFGDALHDLGGVIADANDGIGAELSGMLQHQIQRFLARPFAEIGEQRDIAADQCLQTGADGPENRTGTYNNPAHQTQSLHNVITMQIKLRGGHVVLDESHRQLSVTSASICLSIFSTRPRTSSRSLRRAIISPRSTSSSSSRVSSCSRRRLASRSAAALPSRADFSSSMAL